MATAYVTFGQVWTRDTFVGSAVRSEVVTTSSGAARGNLEALDGEFAQIVCDVPVYASTAATAAMGNSILCPGGVPTYLSLKPGERISLINVA